MLFKIIVHTTDEYPSYCAEV